MTTEDIDLSALAVTVRTYIAHNDGRLEPFESMPLSHYGTCPNVGDTICYSWFRDRPAVFSVQRRYYIDNHDRRPGWAIILRKIERSTQIDAVVTAWYSDDDFDDKLDEEDARRARKVQDALYENLTLLIGTVPAEFNLDQREENAIQKLKRSGVGVPLVCRAINNFGEGTRRKLQRRGFITLHPGLTGKFRDDEIALTPEGLRALKRLDAYRKKVEAARAAKLTSEM